MGFAHRLIIHSHTLGMADYVLLERRRNKTHMFDVRSHAHTHQHHAAHVHVTRARTCTPGFSTQRCRPSLRLLDLQAAACKRSLCCAFSRWSVGRTGGVGIWPTSTSTRLWTRRHCRSSWPRKMRHVSKRAFALHSGFVKIVTQREIYLRRRAGSLAQRPCSTSNDRTGDVTESHSTSSS